ncbi:MAG TPA: DNA-binding protein [Lachnospiraceae bacterium]|nr:DNA-binding protein [Lachnospiraceae bacterium]
MEKIFEQGLLYDFYGELLTDHQRKIYEDAVYNDMSLSEIAEGQGISRQGVHDLIKRCDKILTGYEEKLHLLKRFTEAKQTIHTMINLTEETMQDHIEVGQRAEKLAKIKLLGNRLLDEL